MENNEELTMEQKLRKLNKLKVELEEAKSEKDQKIGMKDEKLKRLRESYDLKSLGDAKKRILAIEQKVTRRNKRIEDSFNIIMEKYEI